VKLVFSEAHSDYGRYLYPYVIWAFPEPGERPSDFFQRGFLPASPQLDRYYLCRNLRVDLRCYQPSSENRRVLRKGGRLNVELIPRAAFDYSDARRQAWKTFADRRFGEEVMSFQRLDTLMAAPVISHLLRFADAADGREVGTALLYLEPPAIAYYYYAFYDLDRFQQSLGLHMMTRAVGFFAGQGVRHLHLGTCYSDRARYKTQFTGIEFFNGFRWSKNLKELKYLIARDTEQVGRHLLDVPEYVEHFQAGSFETVAGATKFKLAVGGETDAGGGGSRVRD
jgi:arginyl-tRNA--protein-N-Asp/Glu arginylyltransferase